MSSVVAAAVLALATTGPDAPETGASTPAAAHLTAPGPASPAPGAAGVVPAGGLRARPRVAPLCPCPPTRPYGYPPGTPGMPAPLDPANPVPPPDPANPAPPAPNPLAQLQNPFAQATPAGGEGARSFNANFFGDFAGVFVNQTVTELQPVYGTRVVGQRVTLVVDQVVVVPITQQVVVGQKAVTRTIRVPVTGRYNGIQIVDNDQPRPVDRVYFGYNYYDQVGASLNTGAGINLNRETIGFEKTFFDGNASFGLRLPIIQSNGAGLSSHDVGDLTLLFKYAAYNNRETGDLVSVGFVLTTPTGGSGTRGVVGSTNPADLSFSTPVSQNDVPHSWLFQPWAGFAKVYDRAYVQGITNIIVPSDGRDVTVLGNSLAAGYWVYKNPGGRGLTGIIPVAEVHVRTPLSNRDPDGLIFLQDQVNVNAGAHFRTRRAIFSTGISVPTVGPRPWSIEAIGYVNYVF